MVEQNYIVYVNENKNLRTAKIQMSNDGVNHVLKFKIPEKHLICGLILKGVCLKGYDLEKFNFKPIEKYLFEFSNIHFFVLEHEYNAENIEYNIPFDFLGEFIPPYVNENPFTVSTVLSQIPDEGDSYFLTTSNNSSGLISLSVIEFATQQETFIAEFNYNPQIFEPIEPIEPPIALPEYPVQKVSLNHLENAFRLSLRAGFAYKWTDVATNQVYYEGI